MIHAIQISIIANHFYCCSDLCWQLPPKDFHEGGLFISCCKAISNPERCEWSSFAPTCHITFDPITPVSEARSTRTISHTTNLYVQTKCFRFQTHRFDVPVLSVNIALFRAPCQARTWHPRAGAACFTSRPFFLFLLQILSFRDHRRPYNVISPQFWSSLTES